MYIYIHIGSQLMQVLLTKCIEKGLRQIISVIGGGDTNIASIALHKKFGFELVGTFKGNIIIIIIIAMHVISFVIIIIIMI